MHFSNSWVIFSLTNTRMVLNIGFPGIEEHSFASQLLDHNWLCRYVFLNNEMAVQKELKSNPIQASVVLTLESFFWGLSSLLCAKAFGTSSLGSVSQFSSSVMPDSLRPHGLQHARLSCPSPTPGACSNSPSHKRTIPEYHSASSSSSTLLSR